MDSGCPELVAGLSWLETHEQRKGNELPRVNKHDYFKFGDTVYRTEMFVRMDLEIGSIIETVEIGIVKANIPLLISKRKLKEWGGVIDFDQNTLYLKKTKETVKLNETESGHLVLNVGKTIFHNKEELVNEILFIKKKKDYKMVNLKKLHRVFGHPCHQKMEQLMKDSGESDSVIIKMMKKIQEKCSVCAKYKRKPSKPKVAFAKAREVNETVSIDLKPVSSLLGTKDDRQIVYMMDEFSKFTAAGISKNKEAEEVVKIILDKWCLQLMGYPRRSFFADNGTEFKKSTLEELARRLGVKIELTPSYSPWSNGSNERRHGAVNLTVRKLMEDDKDLSLENALQHSIWARNMEIGKLGRSPFQIVFGRAPGLPGFTDGNATTDSVITESDAVRAHFERQERVRLLYRQADSCRRLKDAEKSRIHPYHDAKYTPGDKIMFLDKEDQWNGPAEVQGSESKTIFVTHNGTLKKVATCRSRPWFDENSEENSSGKPPNDSETNESVESNAMSVSEDEDTSESEISVINNERRPKLHRHILFRKRNEDEMQRGKVIKVGKKKSKNKDKCWIELEGDDVQVIDFVRDVERWKYEKKVGFENNSTNEGKEKNDEARAAETAGDIDGVFYLEKQIPIDVLAVMVPVSEQNNPEVEAAKLDELEKFKLFDAYEIVEDKGQERIDGRWVVQKREEHDGLKSCYKARWCLRGFKECFKPRSVHQLLTDYQQNQFKLLQQTKDG